MDGSQRTAAQEWQAHWGLVFSGVLGLGLIALPATTLGLFMEPLQQDFGWSRTRISFGMTLFAVITTPLAPFAGALADRYGSRKIALPGLALNGLALASFALLTGLVWHYMLAWVFYSLTQLLIRTTVWNRAASVAFSASRGLALAVMMGGIPLAQTIAPVIVLWLMNGHGWRAAFAAMGLGWGGLALITAVFLFRETRAQASPAAAVRGEAAQRFLVRGLTFGQAVRDTRIQRIALAILAQSAMAAALSIHMFPLLTQTGVARADAAGIVATLGIAALAGQLVTGWLADRVQSTMLPVTCFGLPAIAYLLLLQGQGTGVLLMCGVLCAGYASSACVTITTYLVSRYGGVSHFGKIYGLISSCMGLGAGVGPLIAGRIFDQTGSYTGFLLLGMGLAVTAGLAVFRLGPYPDYEGHERVTS